ncbi:MAG: TIGR04083 family peptide-modifying radical SAM enzyme [Methanoregulaceae archaeon]
MKNPFHVMLIPTLGCPARCSYCWSSEPGSPRMDLEVIRDVVAWLRDFPEDRVTFTFHGGEPLLAGADFYRHALPLLSEGLSRMNPDFAMQTNLWLMTPEIAEILAEYKVPLGSSIDGPEEINDLQRGDGYYTKTMQGYRIAREQGVRVSFICTFTSLSVKQKEAIFSFFLDNGFTLKLHPALPSLRNRNPEPWALDPADYGDLLVYLLDQSLEHLDDITIMNIDDLVRCVVARRGTVCTFADCMGSTFAVGPDGDIYPCYRFVGMPEWVMGNVRDHPSREELAGSDAGKRMLSYKAYVDQHCRECRHIRYCRGGCPYNAIVPTGGEISGVDPHCTAYRMIFDEIAGRLDREMGENCLMDTMTRPGPRKKGKPGIMSLMQKMVSR